MILAVSNQEQGLYFSCSLWKIRLANASKKFFKATCSFFAGVELSQKTKKMFSSLSHILPAYSAPFLLALLDHSVDKSEIWKDTRKPYSSSHSTFLNEGKRETN